MEAAAAYAKKLTAEVFGEKKMPAPESDLQKRGDEALEALADAYRDYEIEYVTDDGEPYWFGQVPALPGCASDGKTVDELLENLKDAKRTWLALAIEKGVPIPKPETKGLVQ